MNDVERILKVEAEIVELARRESTSVGKSECAGTDSAEQSTEKLESIIRSVGEVSTAGIDRVISQLEDLRAMLRSEGERVTQEIMAYGRLSEMAMSASKSINDRFKQGKNKVDASD